MTVLSDGVVELVPITEADSEALFGAGVMWHSVCGLLHRMDQDCSEGVVDTQPCACCGAPYEEIGNFTRPCGPGQWHVADGPLCSCID